LTVIRSVLRLDAHIGRRSGRDERGVVLADGIVERKDILRQNLAPLDELRFEPLARLGQSQGQDDLTEDPSGLQNPMAHSNVGKR